MAFEILSHYRRWLGQMRALGAPRIVAASLLLASTVFLFAVVRPASKELALREAQSVAPAAEVQQDSEVSKREAFLRAFPRLDRTSGALRAIARAAQETNIDLTRGDYRLVPGREGEQFSRYEISLPVASTYPQVRQFITRVLASLPFAAVDGVAFERSNAADAQLKARIDITLFLRGEQM